MSCATWPVQRSGHRHDTEAESQRLLAAEGLVAISPFDDSTVIAGQGTIGLEMLIARPDLDHILIPLSGGGLVEVAFRDNGDLTDIRTIAAGAVAARHLAPAQHGHRGPDRHRRAGAAADAGALWYALFGT